MLLRWLLAAVLLVSSLQVLGHNRSESFSQWHWQNGNVSYSFSVLQREATRIPNSTGHSLDQLLTQHLADTIAVSVEGKTCAIAQPARSLPAREGYLRVEGAFACESTLAPVITVDSFFDLIATHTHYAKVRSQGRVSEFLLTQSHRRQSLSLTADTGEEQVGGWQAFSQYLWIGAEHILGGIDHLAFVIALLLLATGWREMAWLITGFTVGHSLSLGLAVLGIAQPNSVMVEALIGFTIVLVVMEAVGERRGNLWQLAPALMGLAGVIALALWLTAGLSQLLWGTLGAGLFGLCYLRLVARASRPAMLRLFITSTFGLIHGFGFAGGLLELGFPASELGFVLLGFNVGVELGQLLVLLLVIPALVCLRHLGSGVLLRLGSKSAVISLSALGTFWFVSRLVG